MSTALIHFAYSRLAAIWILPAHHESDFGHLLAIDGSPVDLRRDCIPVDVEKGHRTLLQQFLDRSPRANVGASIMGIMIIVGAQDPKAQLLKGLLETLAHFENIPGFLAVSTARRYVRFGAVGVIKPNWSIIAILGQKLGQIAANFGDGGGSIPQKLAQDSTPDAFTRYSLLSALECKFSGSRVASAVYHRPMQIDQGIIPPFSSFSSSRASNDKEVC